MSNHRSIWIALAGVAGGLGLAGVLAAGPAWGQSARVASCVTFAGVAEAWVNRQLAAGKTEFFSAMVAVNGSVVCAF